MHARLLLDRLRIAAARAELLAGAVVAHVRVPPLARRRLRRIALFVGVVVRQFVAAQRREERVALASLLHGRHPGRLELEADVAAHARRVRDHFALGGLPAFRVRVEGVAELGLLGRVLERVGVLASLASQLPRAGASVEVAHDVLVPHNVLVPLAIYLLPARSRHSSGAHAMGAAAGHWRTRWRRGPRCRLSHRRTPSRGGLARLSAGVGGLARVAVTELELCCLRWRWPSAVALAFAELGLLGRVVERVGVLASLDSQLPPEFAR